MRVYEALRRKIAVPFRKSDAERQKNLKQLRMVDRGGMIFQPKPGLYENVYQLDFTSMYPSIIVKYNLSPETVHSGKDKIGFLPVAIKSLLELRIKTKRLRKVDAGYKGIDSILKWMLVTCFGYTGYRNAKFGRIEVHESINKIGREILLKAKEIAEDMGFEVIHGIVDCLWLRNGERITKEKLERLREKVERETKLLNEIEFYNWIAFIPMNDGFGAYNRYYGLSNGKMKVRGVALRRRDTPAYIKDMQREIFNRLSKADNKRMIRKIWGEIEEIYQKYRENLRRTRPKQLVIRKVIGKRRYSKRCVESFLLEYCRKRGVKLEPGMEIGYIVLDSKKWIAIPSWEVCESITCDSITCESTTHDSITSDVPDFPYYLKLLEGAWKEIAVLKSFLEDY